MNNTRMKKIAKYLQKSIQNLGLDKKEHVIVGVIYSIFIVLGGIFGIYGAIIGFTIGTFLNLWKEIWNDKIQKKGSAEFWDFVATELPIVITFIAYLL